MQQYLMIGAIVFVLGLIGCGHRDDFPTNPTDDPTDTPTDTTQTLVCFTRDVLPILQSSCAISGCHDSRTRAEGLDLSTYETIFNWRDDDDRVIVPGNPYRSKIYQVLIETDDDRMPPPPMQPLPSSQIWTIRRWIEQGARKTTCDNGAGSPCDTTNVSYAKVEPIVQQNCVSCHSGPSAAGRIDLTTYQSVTNNGARIVESVMQTGSAVPMPPGRKLDDCSIRIIRQWYQKGMPR